MKVLNVVAGPAGATSQTDPAGLLTIAETRARLRVSRSTLHQAVKRGAIPCLRLGGRVLFSWPQVLAALERQQRQEVTA
jgi:excisionase family DNA binding protein